MVYVYIYMSCCCFFCILEYFCKTRPGLSSFNLDIRHVWKGQGFITCSKKNKSMKSWLVVEPTPLKNMGQNGNPPQIGVKSKNLKNHHPEKYELMSTSKCDMQNIRFYIHFFLGKRKWICLCLSSLHQTDPHHHTRDKKLFPITVGRR